VRRALATCLALLGILGPGRTGAAQPADDGARTRLLSDSARVSLITILPGEKVYSLFGHNAIRVVDPLRGIDIAYNYGTFNFGNPLSFTAKFAYGDLNYRLARQDYSRMVAYYPVEEGRPIIEQWLDLNAEQREAVFRFLEWNALPENAFYRYDFYYDNCATRIRDVFEDILGEALEAGTEDPGRTMRQLLDPYLVGKPMLHVGMDFAQGVPADVPASGRDELFLPDRLARWVERAELRGPDGRRALVARTDSIGWTPERARIDPVPPWPGLLFGGLFLLVAGLTVRDVRAGRRGRPWLDGPLYALLGVAGLFVVFVWFFSLHDVARRNVNILWVVPTHVILAGVLLRKRRPGWVGPYLWGTVALAAAFLAGLPFWTQEVPAALVPLVLAVLVRSAGLALTARGSGPAAGGLRRNRPAGRSSAG
jgi:hypothetical protein